MSFLLPLYLAGAALVVLPVVLHLLRRDVAPPVPFTAVHLLQRTSVDRARHYRLRDLLLLLARLAALLLLAASFARPYRPAAAAVSRTTVVAVDRSFSMTPARMARARALALQAIDQSRGDRIFLIGFDDRAEVLSASGAAADARAAVERLHAGFGATRYAAALDKAAELLLDDEARRVIIVSDLQRSGFDESQARLPEGIDLVVHDTGAAAGNLSVANAVINRRHVAVTVRNAGDRPLDTKVSVSADGLTLPPRPVTIPANGTVDVSFDAGADVTRATAAVVNDWQDGYDADNTRYAVRADRGLPRVLVVSGAAGSRSGFYLTRALLAEGDEGPDFSVRAMSGPAFSGLKDDALRDESAIVLLSTHGLDRRAGESLRRFLRAGGGVLVASAPDVDATVLSVLFDWSPVLQPEDVDHAGVLAATDLRHPVLRPFDAVAANFGQVAFEHAWKIDERGPWRVMARFTNGAAALAERTGGPGRLLLFTSDVDRHWNDFPLHASFVPFAHEAVRYLAARAAVASTFLVADVPAGVPARPGLVERDGRLVAVNVDPRESRVDRVTPAEFRAMVTRTAAPAGPRAASVAADAERQQNYWRYGLMLMFLALVCEAFIGSR